MLSFGYLIIRVVNNILICATVGMKNTIRLEFIAVTVLTAEIVRSCRRTVYSTVRRSLNISKSVNNNNTYTNNDMYVYIIVSSVVVLVLRVGP